MPEQQPKKSFINKFYLKKINNFLLSYFKIFIFVVVLILLSLGYLFLVKPKYEQVNAQIKNFKDSRETLYQKNLRTLNELNDYIESYESIPEENVKKVHAMLPDRYNKEELFSELNHLVSGNNLTLKSVKVKGDGGDLKFGETKGGEKKGENKYIDKPEDVETYTVTMSILGTNYGSLKNLLFTLERNMKLLDITELNFSPSGKTVNITLQTYYSKK